MIDDLFVGMSADDRFINGRDFIFSEANKPIGTPCKGNWRLIKDIVLIDFVFVKGKTSMISGPLLQRFTDENILDST